MLEKVAPEIATSTSEIIGYDVIITNEAGIIIGASDNDRLHTIHEASIPVIKNNRPLITRPGYIDNFKGTKPGFTLPIEIQGNVIGTIAITGNRSEVEKYGPLVRKHTEIMLREAILLESSIFLQQAHHQFIKEILAFDSNQYSEVLLKARSFELGYELKPPFICVAVEILNMRDIIGEFSESRHTVEAPETGIQRTRLTVLKEIQSIFTHADLSTYIGEDKFIILHKARAINDSYNPLASACNRLLERLVAKSIKAIVGIGSPADKIMEIKRSNREAWKVVEIGKKQKGTVSVFHVNDYFLETLVQSMDSDVKGMLTRELKQLLKTNDWEDIAQTIKAWCDSGFNKVHTASSLHIHRNTLQYRLERIEELTGVSIKDYRKMLYLYLGISLIEMEIMGIKTGKETK